MKLIISKDGPSCGEVSLQRFFQFSVIGKKKSDATHQIDMFNAICFKAESTTLSVSMECDIYFKNFQTSKEAEKRIQTKFTDKVEYFEQLEILKQFWGKKAFSSSNREEFITKIKEEFTINPDQYDDLTTDVNLIYEVLDKTNSLPLFINDNKEQTDKFDKFIILPFKAFGKSTNKVMLKSSKELSVLKVLHDKISLGFWFHNVADVKLKSLINTDIINSEIEFKSNVTSPDFKIYYQVDESVELKKNKIIIDSHIKEPVDAEIIQVYSQSEINYFKDWAELGIYSSRLLRLHNNTKVNNKISNEFKSVKSELELEDVEAKNKKETNLFILSIFISALMAMGLDATRLMNPTFLLNFPTIPIFSEAFIWFLICAGLIPKYLVLRKTFNIKPRYKTFIKFFSLLAFIWVVCCFFIQKEILIGLVITNPIDLAIVKLTHWIQFFPIIDMILTIYLSLSLIFYSYYDRHKKYQDNKFLSVCKLIFGVS